MRSRIQNIYNLSIQPRAVRRHLKNPYRPPSLLLSHLITNVGLPHHTAFFCFPAQLCGWHSRDKAGSTFVIISAEKVCRLFRGFCSGLAVQITPLHNQHTYSANHKYSHIKSIRLLFPPVFLFLFFGKGILKGL